jgi:hypothetical protein
MKLSLCFTIAINAYKVHLNRAPLISDLGTAGGFISEETAVSTHGMRLVGPNAGLDASAGDQNPHCSDPTQTVS